MGYKSLGDRCRAMLDEAAQAGHHPVGWAVSGDLYWLDADDELTEMLGLPVAHEVRLPPNSVFLITAEESLPV